MTIQQTKNLHLVIHRLVGEGFRIHFFPNGIYLLYYANGNKFEIRQPIQLTEDATIERIQWMEYQIKKAL